MLDQLAGHAGIIFVDAGGIDRLEVAPDLRRGSAADRIVDAVEMGSVDDELRLQEAGQTISRTKRVQLHQPFQASGLHQEKHRPTFAGGARPPAAVLVS
ncbi:hypothetical protein JW805_19145 [Roseomonas aeriglobus]|nr:hypothetical protein [Roseomonas aeriglobus]